jgi:hypothetical protein
MAIAIRCGVIPRSIDTSVTPTCSCGTIDFANSNQLQIIEHALNCSTAGFSPATRHNFVKSAVARQLRKHGFPVVLEPTCYSKLYSDNIAHRPDLLVHTSPPISTDFVVTQQHGVRPGASSAAAAKKKNDTHKSAVAKLQHVFFPFALEAHGYEHRSFYDFVAAVTSHRPRFEHQALQQDLRTAVAVALARARCQALAALYAVGHFTVCARHQDETGDADAGDEGLAA